MKNLMGNDLRDVVVYKAAVLVDKDLLLSNTEDRERTKKAFVAFSINADQVTLGNDVLSSGRDSRNESLANAEFGCYAFHFTPCALDGDHSGSVRGAVRLYCRKARYNAKNTEGRDEAMSTHSFIHHLLSKT